MGYNDEFFGSSLNSKDVKSVSRWEVDRILNTVSTMKKGSSKKHKVSDEEIDKILSEKFIPIIQKENSKDNISGNLEEDLPDIPVIEEVRHFSGEIDSKDDEKEKTIKIPVEQEFQDSDIEEEVTKKKKRKRKGSDFLISFLSFVCLSLCVLLCVLILSIKR